MLLREATSWKIGLLHSDEKDAEETRDMWRNSSSMQRTNTLKHASSVFAVDMLKTCVALAKNHWNITVWQWTKTKPRLNPHGAAGSGFASWEMEISAGCIRV